MTAQSGACAPRPHLLRTIKAWLSSLLLHRSSAVASSTASPELEDGLDAVVEEAVDHVHGAPQRHDAEEEREEPGQGDGRQGREVMHVLRQLRELLL